MREPHLGFQGVITRRKNDEMNFQAGNHFSREPGE